MVKSPPANAGDRETWARSQVRQIPWRRKWQPSPVLLLRKSHGQRSLAGSSPWGRTESDTTEQSTDFGDCLLPALHASSVSHAAPLRHFSVRNRVWFPITYRIMFKPLSLTHKPLWSGPLLPVLPQLLRHPSWPIPSLLSPSECL